MSTVEMLAMRTKAGCAESIELSHRNQKLIYDALEMIEDGLEDPNHIGDLCGVIKNAVGRYVTEIEELNSLLAHQSDLLITLDKVSN